MKPRVFVVMPFNVKKVREAAPATDGKPAQDEVSINCNELYDLLIAPALARAGAEPFRADREKAAGDIRTDMFFELVTADFVLADISLLNANVFYELGIRHGVAERGVIMIHGGWSEAPFDIVTDRRFRYDGALWDTKAAHDAVWQAKLGTEIDALAAVLRGAIENDATSIGSPVYKELQGLKPVDWREIQTARAKYFRGVLDDWRQRVKLAKRKGRPGDILTLAGDSPTRHHQKTLLFEAAKGLIELGRFLSAKEVLQELRAMAPGHLEAACQLGLVHNRLGETEEAKLLMQELTSQHQNKSEAQGVLGRIYKDCWRARWDKIADLKERQLAAVAASKLAAVAASSYDQALRVAPDYYNGINVVTLVRLLEHLKQETGETPSDTDIRDFPDVVSVVRFCAQIALQRVRGKTDDGSLAEAIWATATLAELALMMGDGKAARRLYQETVNLPGITYFIIRSMRSQLELLERLAFQAADVAAAMKVLDEGIQHVPQPPPAFKKIAVFSGHMIDLPGRTPPRFPPEKEGVVRDRLKAEMAAWALGPGDLAICGGARGGDILFAELCLEAGAHLRLLLALPEGEFLERSVRLPGTTTWENRFQKLRRHPRCETWFQHEHLGPPPAGVSVFERTNLWMIHTARVEVPPDPLYAAFVWDEKPTGDGPGGTSHFFAQIRQMGAIPAIINPTLLPNP